MSFETNRLSVVSYIDGFTIFRWRTDGLIQPKLGDLNFPGAHKMFRIGDIIFATIDHRHTMAVVTYNDGEKVEVQSMITHP